MSQPEPTSPEVADACRRAGLPYDPPAQQPQDNIAMAAGRLMTQGVDEFTAALDEARRLLMHATGLYGPALLAPLEALVGRLDQAGSVLGWELGDLQSELGAVRRRLQMAVDHAGELRAERDRARATAVALEQEVAGQPTFLEQAAAAIEAHIPVLPSDLNDTVSDGWNRGRNAGRELALSAIRELAAAVDDASRPRFLVHLTGDGDGDQAAAAFASAREQTVVLGAAAASAKLQGSPPDPPVTVADTSGCAGAKTCTICSVPVGLPHLRGCSQVKAGFAKLAGSAPLSSEGAAEVQPFPPGPVDPPRPPHHRPFA